MILRSLIPALILLAAFPGPRPGAAAQDAALDGEWELVTKAPQNEVVWKVVFKRSGEDLDVAMTTPRGERTSTYTFKQDGESLTVVTTGRNDEEITGTGTLKGADIEWSITRTSPRGEFTMTYKGKVDGDTVAGEAQMGDFGSAEWKAVRKTA